MKRLSVNLLLLLVTLSMGAQWQPAGEKIKTVWAEKIDINNVLPEYPRPMLTRTSWQSLNGLWDYAITVAGAPEPEKSDGQILVPFAIESSLSGVQKSVGPENELWYRRIFTVPSSWKNRQLLLHFGAVDWRTDVFINDIKIGSHQGGYSPFTFNITPFLNRTGPQELTVKVWDPTDKGFQPRGKQVLKPGGIFYTAVTGIWQTVWIEPVNTKHITAVRTVPDIDNNRIMVEVLSSGTGYSDICEVTVLEGDRKISSARASAGQKLEVPVPDAKLWAPDSPFLYRMHVTLKSKEGIEDDAAGSYFAMRKISVKRDASGIMRLQLNNRDLFLQGPLDQGWWPDGLYTAPTDEALKYDIIKTRDFGFNMIRKHVKVEPSRWYMHCDQLGILVWQDMPSGDKSPVWQNTQYFTGTEFIRAPESEENYRSEWKEIIDLLYSHPSIVCWVPFNESWGQFKTPEIVAWTKNYDKSRLVNPASGGNHYPVGDMLDIHHYPNPDLYLYEAARPTVLGEYGGIGMPVDGHVWETGRNWGYIQFKSAGEVTDQYVKYANDLLILVKAGFSAGVYTQTTDVESEVNGLMTYDRKVIKIDEKRVKEANQKLCRSLSGTGE